MKHSCYSILAIFIVMVSCTKPRTITNNHYIPAPDSKPAFGIDGITDVTFTNNFSTAATLALTVRYYDSVQENITLSVSGLPSGVVIDTNWIHSGFPTFSTNLNMYDTGIPGGAAPGNYPITITATTASGKQKFYKFNMKVNAMPLTFLGKYNDCRRLCSPNSVYTDSVYLDPVVTNKVWFVNYANTGQPAYGMLTGQGGGIIIPGQTLAGQTYSGSGNVAVNHTIIISMSPSCALNMF